MLSQQAPGRTRESRNSLHHNWSRNLAEIDKQLNNSLFYKNSFNQFNRMSLPDTPSRAIKREEADTVKKSRFFEAFDARTHESLHSFATQHAICKRTASYWLHQRQNQGSPAYRRSLKCSTRLGRPPKLTNDQIQCLLSPSNPTRNQHYEHQIQHFDLACSVSTLQKALQKRTNHTQRYKPVRVKQISKSNKAKRKKYGQEHQAKTIDEFWAKTQPKLTDLDGPFWLAPMPLYVSQIRARLNFGSASIRMHLASR
jgi:hypothetical protein